MRDEKNQREAWEAYEAEERERLSRIPVTEKPGLVQLAKHYQVTLPEGLTVAEAMDILYETVPILAKQRKNKRQYFWPPGYGDGFDPQPQEIS